MDFYVTIKIKLKRTMYDVENEYNTKFLERSYTYRYLYTNINLKN